LEVSFDLPPWPLPDPPEMLKLPFIVNWGVPDWSNRRVGPREVPDPVMVRFLHRASGRSTVTVTPGVEKVTSLESPGTWRLDQVLVSLQFPDAAASKVRSGRFPMSDAVRGLSLWNPFEYESMPTASRGAEGICVPESVFNPAKLSTLNVIVSDPGV
jgi:hypothetical protein